MRDVGLVGKMGLSKLTEPSSRHEGRDRGFRETALRAYKSRCALCELDVRVDGQPIGLEATHIKWHSATGEDLPVFAGHIYSDSNGNFPAKLNNWESRVIATETARPSFVAWYRNGLSPQRATPNSLRIAYQDESEHWRSMQVDFIIISKRQDGTLAASIVDPHGDHLSDAKAKLRALAEFAEQFRDQFLRIESIAEVSGELRSVDLRDSRIRDAVRAFEGGGVSPLYTSEYSTLTNRGPLVMGGKAQAGSRRGRRGEVACACSVAP